MLLRIKMLLWVAALVSATGWSGREALARQVPAPSEMVDRSGSPFFFVAGARTGVEVFPLAASRAEVSIAGVIAHVRVTQEYKNLGTKPIEATYVFPASTRASVFAMKMKIGDREVRAQIQKKGDARATYEQAKRDGKTASLLEQERPNVFQMNVANILPGDRVEVVLDYAELLVPESGRYEFVLPAVVGPRYTGESSTTEEVFHNPTLLPQVKVPYAWDVKVHVAGGMPIRRVESPSHPIATTMDNPSTAEVTLPNPGAAGSKDFVLRYALTGPAIEAGLLLTPPKKNSDNGYFLAMVQPPSAIGRELVPPREYTFILDVSGSMRGFPLDTARALMSELLDGMGPADRFNILCFSMGGRMLAPQAMPVTDANRAAAKRFMEDLQGGGGTELMGALKQAFAAPSESGLARTFVVVTDGYVSVEPQIFRTIRENLGRANFFAMGIGSAVNRFLIEGMARSGMGEPFFVLNADEAAAKAAAFRAVIERPVLTDLKVQIDGFNAFDLEPVAIPDMFANRPILVFGKYRGAATGRITLSGRSGAGPFEVGLPVTAAAVDAKNDALGILWARHRIATLSDYNALEKNPALEAEVTQLGLDYQLLTAFTSFVAVDSEVRNRGGEQATVPQPLPLPDGLAESAVGGVVGYGQGSGGGGVGYGRISRGGVTSALGGGMPVQSTVTRESPPTAPAPREADALVSMDEKKAQQDGYVSVRAVELLEVKTLAGPRSAGDVRRAVLSLLPRLAQCARSQRAGAVVRLELVVDAAGRTKVRSGWESGGWRGCPRSLMEGLRLGAVSGAGGRASIVAVTLKLVP